MVRTQIQLTKTQAKALKRLARERDVSMAALIREGVDRVVADGEWTARRRRALEALRRNTRGSGHSDISENHDAYLAEDFLDWRS